MSNVLPKEQMSAYQRWELASFGDERQSTKEVAAPAISPEQLAAIREQARMEGFTEGFTQGQSAGLENGRLQARAETEALMEMAQSFREELIRSNETVAQGMLDLTLDIAKAMFKTALVHRPELVLATVKDAIHYLPNVQQPALLFLNPEDREIVETHMGNDLAKAGWRVTDDPDLQRGGCRVETASNQIDATVESRWQRIAAALGKDMDWLAL